MSKDLINLIEAIARALKEHFPLLSHSYARELARAALLAIETEGFVVVPVEPTEEMKAEGSSAVYDCYSLEPGEGFDEPPAPAVYAAMLSARPKVVP